MTKDLDYQYALFHGSPMSNWRVSVMATVCFAACVGPLTMIDSVSPANQDDVERRPIFQERDIPCDLAPPVQPSRATDMGITTERIVSLPDLSLAEPILEMRMEACRALLNRAGISKINREKETTPGIISEDHRSICQSIMIIELSVTSVKNRIWGIKMASSILDQLWRRALEIQQAIGRDILDGRGHLANPFDVLLAMRRNAVKYGGDGLLAFRLFFGNDSGSIAWKLTSMIGPYSDGP